MSETSKGKCSKFKTGVDLNRNYGYAFGEQDGGEKECEYWVGPKAFSEPET